MSEFLVVVEIGKAVPPSALLAPLRGIPIEVRPNGADSRPRRGIAIHDGVMRAAGVGAVAHAGEQARGAFVRYVRERLERHGAHARTFAYTPIHLAFLTFAGPVVEATIDIRDESIVTVADLEAHLIRLRPAEVLGVTAGGSAPAGHE